MAAKQSSSIDRARLQELDALFRIGGLVHSPRKKLTSRAGNVISSPKKSASGAMPAPKKPSKQNTGPEILRVPQWEKQGWLVHGFSTRSGGVSTAYQPRDLKQGCGELNLGFTAADSRGNVERNRKLFVQALLDGGRNAARPGQSQEIQLRLLRQIHSGLVHRASHRANKNSAPAEPLRGDGWIATEPGALLGIQTADCIPVLVVDVRQRIVAAFHAGWRGTLARIVERGVGRLRAEFGSRQRDLTAAIGPGIGRCCYSVGEEVRMEFTSQFGYADALFEEVFDLDPIKKKYPMLFLTARAPGHSNLGPSLHLDLVEANRRQLLDAGIAAEKIHSLDLCTGCDRKRFFSYRAEHGFTGRMISAIGIRP
ncbi:MAG: peptidoglycan editing factor PgeF [Acidobacteriaceae bacterium]